MNDFLAKNSDMLKNVSIGVLLIAILYLGMNGQWVFGKDYEAMKASYEKQLSVAISDRDEWKKLALDGLRVAREISPARIPIMASAPGDNSPNDIAEQLQIIKNMNNDEKHD